MGWESPSKQHALMQMSCGAHAHVFAKQQAMKKMCKTPVSSGSCVLAFGKQEVGWGGGKALATVCAQADKLGSSC